jgi:hypothetical protein
MSTHGHSWSDRVTSQWSVILAWVLSVAAVAALVAVLFGGHSTTVVRTVIVRTPPVSAAVTEDTPAGALADAQAFWAGTDGTPGRLQTWTLAYKIDTYTPSTATLDSWGLATGGGEAGWRRVRVTVHYGSGRWQPVAVTDFAMVPDSTLDPSSPQFARTIAQFHRFPGAP